MFRRSLLRFLAAAALVAQVPFAAAAPADTTVVSRSNAPCSRDMTG